MKYKLSEILELNESLNTVDLKGVKISYAIARNIALLKSEIESLQRAQKPSKDYVKYDLERLKLCKECAIKDERNQPVIENGVYQFVDQAVFDKKFEALKKEHKKAVDERKKQMDEFKDLLETTKDIELFKVSIDHVPEDITSSQLRGIMDIIEDGEVHKKKK